MSDNRKLLERHLKAAEEQVGELRAVLNLRPVDFDGKDDACARGCAQRSREQAQHEVAIWEANRSYNAAQTEWNRVIGEARKAGFDVKYTPVPPPGVEPPRHPYRFPRSVTRPWPTITINEVRDTK